MRLKLSWTLMTDWRTTKSTCMLSLQSTALERWFQTRMEVEDIFVRMSAFMIIFMSIQYSPNLATLDVQAVNATVVGESTIDVQCLFIRGSDAVGCKITFVSECPDVADKNVNIIRSDKSNTGRLILTTYNISCYLKLFAYHIDANNTLSNVSIEGRIRRMANNESPGNQIT